MSDILSLFSTLNNKQFLFLALAIVLSFALLYFLWNFLKVNFFRKKGAKTMAQVVETKDVNEENFSYQEVTLIYKDETGMEYSSTIANEYAPYKMGEMVEIFYDKNNPSDLAINNWRQLYMKMIFSFLVAALVAAAMIYLLKEGKIEIFWG